MSVFDNLSKGMKGKVNDPKTGKLKRGPKKQNKMDTTSHDELMWKRQQEYLWNCPDCWTELGG